MPTPATPTTRRPAPTASPASGSNTNPGDEAPPGTPGTGEGPCRRCSGTGVLLQAADPTPCPDCGGTGKVIQVIGGA